MFLTQQPWAELYRCLMELDETLHAASVVVPWLNEHPNEVQWLRSFREGTAIHMETSYEDLCVLYAISRVTQLMMLRFQSGSADGSDYGGPLIDQSNFQSFHEAIGLTPFIPTQFHPIQVEVVSVIEDAKSDSGPKLRETVWPGLMLGDLVFQRAGCRVSAGEQSMSRELAERSPMYWAYRRKHRRYSDKSHGWGGNSQWRTAFRRDYVRDSCCQYNVDGCEMLERHSFDEQGEGISFDGMLEVLRHRCQIKTTCQHELTPYSYRWAEPITMIF